MPPRVDGTSPALQYLPLHLLLRAFSSPWTRTLMSRECQKKDWAAHKEGCQRIEQQALLMDADLDRAQARGAWCTAGAERLAWIVRPEPGEHLAFIIQFNADILTTPHNATTVFTRREARCYTPGRVCAFIWEVLATPGSTFFSSNPEAE
ncbi:hypothetical protein BV25DRAFT_1842290 [Artomyces pyxidatus]|uniref:Uncharacterized protein n=1 Tax=Artomyces pyxidatus TaxID=48021 RepID=A0ACB8SJ17_9AGAM|nr:hypothetical protein BV25DRAFT_1842290 [Artomyces pyxidatus]